MKIKRTGKIETQCNFNSSPFFPVPTPLNLKPESFTSLILNKFFFEFWLVKLIWDPIVLNFELVLYSLLWDLNLESSLIGFWLLVSLLSENYFDKNTPLLTLFVPCIYDYLTDNFLIFEKLLLF